VAVMADFARWSIGLVLLGAVGCGVDPGSSTGGSSGTGGSGGAGGAGCPNDPAEGAVSPECGVWVSVSLGDDANAGTQGAPVATLTHAVELAAKGSGRVYACGGETWTEPLTVPMEVSLYGGFDCAAGWKYVGPDKRAILAPSSTLAMTWEGGVPNKYEDQYLTDFHVESVDATEPGGSSIALFIRGDVRLNVLRCDIVAGNAASGNDGESAEDALAPPGQNGNDGADACSAPLSKGGAAPESVCELEPSKGGQGGDAGPMLAASGADGEPVSNPPEGSGGLGEQSAPSCTDGQPGANGGAGISGIGGKGKGRLIESGYLGADGKPGGPGAPGQGGGGGGATFGKVAVCGAANPGGAAGGSGGSGGCGGHPGAGGQAGGASFAIASRSAHGFRLAGYTVLTSGNGGDGGRGGKPQFGGKGGLPGQGGAGMGSIQPGCAGAQGGAGGPGGWGGGGMAGPTAPMAVVDFFTVALEHYVTHAGKVGQFGYGESPANEAGNGSTNEGNTVIVLDP